MLNIFDLTMKLNGFPLAEAKKKLQEINSVSEEDYFEFLEKKKNEIVEYHLKENNFYRNFVGEKNIERWEDLPIMKKSDFQKPLKERLSNGFTTKNVYINKTSGSSGNPFVFAKDKPCHAIIWANFINRFGWHGIDFNYSWQARFYGMPLDFISICKLRAKDFLSRRYRFNIFDLSDDALEKVLEKFRTKQFDYINGYTTCIVLLAKFLQKKNLYLNSICPSLKVCIVTSEMLFDEDRQLLQERFRIPIVNEYGAAELGIIAFENTEGIWKVNSETLFVEILDENNHALPYGKEGRIVVTSLYNKAHPMIRYEIGDRGILDERSTLKIPILKKLTGRNNDTAVLPSGKKSPGMTFYSITKKLFEDDGNVKEFTIKQTKIDTFQIDYISERELTANEIDKMKSVFSTYLEPNLNYLFSRKENLQREKSGKLKQFVSLI